MASPQEGVDRRLDSTHLQRFRREYAFELDPFQVRACQAVQDGQGVLVAAPTGAGKTVVGEFAAYLALVSGRKTFYTTPIKALSNQKYTDLSARHGAGQVGLLTGDSSINGDAPIVVMTTEVLRNMIYADSPTLAGLGFVVMDEVHYLADRFRGPVWEEVLIQLPEQVQVVSLSATVSNAEEFGDWLATVRGGTEVIVEEHRPVPLWQHMLVGGTMFDVFADDGDDDELRINPQLLRRIERLEAGSDRYGRREDAGAPRGRRGRSRPGHGGPVRHGRPGRGPSRAEVIDALDREGLLPAITFIFSRAGCEGAVSQLLAWGTRLVPEPEGARVRRLVEERVSGIPEEDLDVLGYWDFVEGLTRGFAAHHAGMLPTFREIVEELFTAGQIKAVFATETLALGINMPARTVVLERLVKFNGESHADITPAEYTQLTGRAGRRGIDVEGHAVVLYGRGQDPEAVAGLASRRTYPLNSSFVPTSNMAVNLVGQVGRRHARQVLEASFAQFQADRQVVGVARAIRRNEEGLEGYAEAMRCHLGDFAEYAAIRRELTDLEKQAGRARSASRRAAVAVSLQRLHRGDVVRIPQGRRAGVGVVIGISGGKNHPGPPLVLTMDGRVHRLEETDLHEPLEPFMRLDVPKSFRSRNPRARKDLAATLRAKTPGDLPPRRRHAGADEADDRSQEQVAGLRRRLADHPCHECPYREQHARWAERWWRLQRETEGLQRQVDRRTHTVARTFDRICDLLTDLEYLGPGGTTVTESGRLLQRIYTEKDLLVAECLRRGVWSRLDHASLAAAVSAIVYEPRREAEGPARIPNEWVSAAYETMIQIWKDLDRRRRDHRLSPTGEPDLGMAWSVHRWAGGARLELVLRDSGLTAGDFVRRCKQIVDLLGQIQDVAPEAGVRRAARTAIKQVMRGVVASDRLD